MGAEPEELVSGDGDARRTDPTAAPATEPDEIASSVRASAPTIQGDSDPSVTPKKPVMIRTPVPPSPIDNVVGQLSTTTPTGRAAPISTTLRSGGNRTLIGTTLGRYEIIEELGHGGMATVYRARDPRLERDVALKVIHRHLRDNPEIAERFRHEARAVAKLKHPSIVEIYDVPDIDDEERFLVAELVDGPSLRKYMQTLRAELGHENPGLFPPELAAALVLQILSSLSRAHQEGIVHRDVKPENILVAGLEPEPTRETLRPISSQRTSDPTRVVPVAKLTDFGIAKILDAQSMTSTGQILGSPAHMAPEQIESGDITPRVDIFATGVLFYELLTGQLPFDGKNPAQVIRRVLEGEFTPAERVAPTVGGRWSAIVALMLARDPERRPDSVEVIEAAIRAELEALEVRDPDRELLEFVRNPKTIAASWAERMKPLLLKRAVEAREHGDVVGSAHDLNRALAYDPSDPSLVRAVTKLRARERRMRGLRRATPIALAALLVSVGTFGVVRWAQTRNIAPQPSTSISPSTKTSSSEPTVATDNAPPVADAAATSTTVAVPNTVPTAAPALDAASSRRRVRFNIFPPGSYSIDGGPVHDTFNDPVQELSTGDHTITITGNSGCCEPFTQKFKVDGGEGEQPQPFKLALKPARINVSGAENAKVTVTKVADGSVLATGPAPLSVVLDTTSVEVRVTTEAAGFPTKVQTYTLVPGDARFVQFE